MSPPQPNPIASPPLPPSDPEALVRLLREELIKTQLIVLDLNDRVLEKETEKADAVAILGKVELALEQKLNAIGELQSDHAEQISALRTQLHTAEETVRAKDAALRELSNSLATAQDAFVKLSNVLEARSRDLSSSQQALTSAQAQVEQLTARLGQSELSLATAHQQLSKIRRSALWKWSKLWRSMFGPKL